jgi:hypothetical protein
VALTKKRADLHGVDLHLAVMPAEALTYDDDFFDGVLFNDMLHHVFSLLSGRLFPDKFVRATQIDHLLLQAIGPLGRFACARVVFRGTIMK